MEHVAQDQSGALSMKKQALATFSWRGVSTAKRTAAPS
jgi:hypothetical protein